jgi:hypothetical protein
MTFETFIVRVYEMIDTFVRTHLPPEPRHRGRQPSLCRSEAMALALVSQHQRFSSERDFYRYADLRLRALFPTLPCRPQLNRTLRRQHPYLVRFGQWCATQLDRGTAPLELLDTTAVPLRDRRRGGVGWLPEVSGLGYTLRLGWFDGVKLLLATTGEGVITGYALGLGNANDRALAEGFLAARATADPLLPTAGERRADFYLADKGFGGLAINQHWREAYGAEVATPPQRNAARTWARDLHRAHQRTRRPIETIAARLLHTFRLVRERPHTVSGLLTRVVAKVAVSNVLIWWNRQTGTPDLAIVESIGW